MRRLSLIVWLAAGLATPLVARQVQPPPPPPPATTAPAVQQPGQPPPTGTRPSTGQRGGGRGTPAPSTNQAGRGVARSDPSQNIRLDVAITDTADKSTKKVVSMLIADSQNGRIRSSNNQGMLNVDAFGREATDGRIYVSITIEYMPDRAGQTTNLHQSITLMVAAGKPTLISQSADPGTDRRVTVEVTATVVK